MRYDYKYEFDYKDFHIHYYVLKHKKYGTDRHVWIFVKNSKIKSSMILPLEDNIKLNRKLVKTLICEYIKDWCDRITKESKKDE